MRLGFYESSPTNFGDELNRYLWHRLLPPGFLDEDDSEIFVGIGSIIGEGLFPSSSIKHVLGAGFGGYLPPPDLAQGRWNYVFVRGPRTAERLGLSAEKAICDSAILLRELSDLPLPAAAVDIAFMPHFQSLPRGNWRAVCEEAGITLIDPTDPIELVLAQIRGARLLITEAMHGAIVADALRTPWIAVRPFHPSHHSKWNDWSASLRVSVDWISLPPSSVGELAMRATGRGLDRLIAHRFFQGNKIVNFLDAFLVKRCAKKLKYAAKKHSGQLSDPEIIADLTSRARKLLDEFVDKWTSLKSKELGQ